MQSHNHNASLLNRGDIAHDITSKKTSDVLNKDYKKAYESTKAKAEYEKVLKDAHGEPKTNTVGPFILRLFFCIFANNTPKDP